MTRTQTAVVADDPVILNWLQNAAPGVDFALIRPLDGDDLMERLQQLGKVEMVFFEVAPQSLPARIALMERLLDRLPDVPLAAVGAEHQPDLVLACMRAGARDFFVLKRDEANVATALGRLLKRSAQARDAGRPGGKGKLFTLLAAHPHEGIAFAAAHLALACHEKIPSSERALLVDIATPAGAATIFLNIAQSYSVLDAINDVFRADQTLVDTAFSKHASGLYVLSLPEDAIGRPNFNPDEFLKLLQVLRGLFSVIVVALDGMAPLPLQKALLTAADRSLMMTDQSIVKSRHSKYLLRALRLDDAALDRTGLLVDNYHKRLGLEPQNLAELLDLPLVATLSTDGAARIQSMNAGEPMYVVAPKDTYCGDMRRLAQALLEGQAKAGEAPKGALSKLFS